MLGHCVIDFNVIGVTTIKQDITVLKRLKYEIKFSPFLPVYIIDSSHFQPKRRIQKKETTRKNCLIDKHYMEGCGSQARTAVFAPNILLMENQH